MTHNSLAPSFVKVFYSVGARNHIATLPCRIDGTPTPGVEPEFIQNNGLLTPAATAVDEYCDAIRVIFHNTAIWTGFEVWAYDGSEDPIFIYADDLNLAGTNATTPNVDGMATLTFRTSNGGIGKIVLMEHSAADDARIPLRASSPAPWNTMYSYFTGALGWVIGRDDGEYIGGIFVTTKTNDALRRKRLLGT